MDNPFCEYQTVDLTNKCMTKDFLRDFLCGFTVYGEQQDRTLTWHHKWIREGEDLWGCVSHWVEQSNENTMQLWGGPRLSSLFEVSMIMSPKHWYLDWGTWLPSKNDLRWDPWYQGTRAPQPWDLVQGYFFILFSFNFFDGSSFFSQKNDKKHCFLSVFPLFLSLFLSFSVHTLWVLLSLMNFTKVTCLGFRV